METFKYYDVDQVKSFIDKVLYNFENDFDRTNEARRSGVDPVEVDLGNGITRDEYLAVTRALAAVLVVGVDLRKELGIRKRKSYQSKRCSFDETIHSPEFEVLMALERKEISYTEAEQRLIDESNPGRGRTATHKFIKKRRSAAKDANALYMLVLKELQSKP
jgi:hypothetical protein